MSAQQQLAQVDDWAKVSRIVDGDTVHLTDGRKIRFIGINTPEIGRRGARSQPYARKAREALVELLGRDKKIGLTYDKDKKDHYKRVLAYINLPDGRSIEQLLLAKGLAHSIVVPPNDARIQCYRRVEREARDAQKGIWRLQENQWQNASQLSKKSKGQRFVKGRITAYSESRKSIYLQLSKKLAIRIAKKDRQYFPGLKLKNLVGKYVRVRGWVSTYKGRQSIAVRTAHDLIIPSTL
ncbi:thermonuclease family protein [sulfur-oxidizing endosymbiont of Gigantopelta aegis]|uniref:thermonuclease family protein n=1 Tax=sulfur-oxidizing endosymbiont of Gigantopelta aegis TaxID=2794934 RepID=UPI0018DB4004|nr:thermonuclease family protein [sulfur-oxidizing endosymbiont of Gigantopelta aegis]